MVNKVILVGRVGQDPEVRRLDSGAVVAKFSLATNERWRDKDGNQQESTEWHNVVLWRGLAEVTEKYVKKGRQVYIEGKLTHRKYTDANGVEKYITDVVANTMQMLGSRDGNSGGGGYNMPSASDEPVQTPKNNTSAPTAPTPAAPKAEEVTDAAGDDLPF